MVRTHISKRSDSGQLGAARVVVEFGPTPDKRLKDTRVKVTGSVVPWVLINVGNVLVVEFAARVPSNDSSQSLGIQASNPRRLWERHHLIFSGNLLVR